MNMYVNEKSDSVIVLTKPSNKEGSPSAEMVEGRTLPEGNSDQTAAVRTQCREAASNGLMAVRQAALRFKAQAEGEMRFNALLHHINVELLEQSYFALKRMNRWCEMASLRRRS